MFETAMFLDAMEKLCNECHKNSGSKGFWDGPENCNIPTKLALMHSEVSEMLEAYRNGNPICKNNITILNGGETVPIRDMEEEAADILIRLADLCGYLGIDLGRVTLAKMEYNAKREHMHGGKRV